MAKGVQKGDVEVLFPFWSHMKMFGGAHAIVFFYMVVYSISLPYKRYIVNSIHEFILGATNIIDSACLICESPLFVAMIGIWKESRPREARPKILVYIYIYIYIYIFPQTKTAVKVGVLTCSL